jgi:protein tyrosine phosphatase
MLFNTVDIELEWSQLEPSPNFITEPELFSVSLKNQINNRYPNILALESTRVRLSNNEYINANYVEILNNYRCIATQAPLPTTIDNFWRMIFENNIEIIIMLTKLIENQRAKATTYWPINEEKPYESNDYYLTVSLLSENSISKNIILREFEIVNHVGLKKRVKHLQFTGWPDFGVPDSYKEILFILEFVLETSGIPVVHCSAGVGRAGTFLTLLNYLKAQRDLNEKLKISQIISMMRSQRAGAVQTKEQFCFIYSVLQHQLRETRSCLTKSIILEKKKKKKKKSSHILQGSFVQVHN